MNSEEITAPEANSAQKRVRFEPPTASDTTAPTDRTMVQTSALAAAKATLVQGSSALPNPLQDTVKKEAQRYVELLKSLRGKEKSKKKYDDPSFIPQSLQVKVKLTGTSRTKKSKAFEDIAKTADEHTRQWHLKMKQCTHLALDLEIEALKDELAQHGIRFVRLFCQAELLIKLESRNQDVITQLAANVIADPLVKKILFDLDPEKLAERYLPCEDGASKSVLLLRSTYSPLEQAVRKNTVSTLVSAITRYDKIVKEKERHKEMAAMTMETLADASAEAMMVEVDSIMQDLSTQDDRDEYAIFKLFKEKERQEYAQKEPAVKDHRGARGKGKGRGRKPPTSAPSTKKTSKKTSLQNGNTDTGNGNGTAKVKRTSKQKKQEKKQKSGKRN